MSSISAGSACAFNGLCRQLLCNFCYYFKADASEREAFSYLNQVLDDGEKVTHSDVFLMKCKVFTEALESMNQGEKAQLVKIMNLVSTHSGDFNKVMSFVIIESVRSLVIDLDSKMRELETKYAKIRASTRSVNDLPQPMVPSLTALLGADSQDCEKAVAERLIWINSMCGPVLVNIRGGQDVSHTLDLLEPQLDNISSQSRTQVDQYNLSLFFLAARSLGPEAQTEDIANWNVISLFLTGEMQHLSPDRFFATLRLYEHISERMAEIKADAEQMRAQRKDPTHANRAGHNKLVYEKIILDQSLDARFDAADKGLQKAYGHSLDTQLKKVDLCDPSLSTEETKSADYVATMYVWSVEALSASEKNQLDRVAAIRSKTVLSDGLSSEVKEEIIGLQAKIEANYHAISTQCEKDRARRRKKGKKKKKNGDAMPQGLIEPQTVKPQPVQREKSLGPTRETATDGILNQDPTRTASELCSVISQLSTLQDEYSEEKSGSISRKYQRAVARLPQHLREEYQTTDAAIDFRDFVLGKKLSVDKTTAMLKIYRSLLQQRQKSWKAAAHRKGTDDLPLIDAGVIKEVEALNQAFDDL